MGSVADDSSSKASSHSCRPPLPVMALREKIVEKVRENRVTLIVGDTGCGKSSQVPLFLLEENMQPIICTQPRRFAVVTIARMVAKSRNCVVGEEVGYHIGHSKVLDMTSSRSKIVFKTAGVLLEQMRDKGLDALHYNVIILDEVHERSVESDLVLACVKQFMVKNKDLRVVLMSATADITRYRDYFKDLGRDERVEVIAIPSAPKDGIFQRRVLYLEQVAKMLEICPQSLSDRYCSGLSPTTAVADMNKELHALIHKLIMYIHQTEPDIEKSVLVFLPTYHALEQQWILLMSFVSLFRVHILHRSIDTDEALLAMQTSKSHRKKVLDPPDSETVEDAISLLARIDALGKTSSHRGRYEPTFYGRLLDSLPLSFDASILALKFGRIGLLREGILISILMDIQPLPILQPFGQQILCSNYLDSYLGSECCNILRNGKKEILFMANLCAYQFWQRVFKDKLCMERLKQVAKVDAKQLPPLIPKLEEEWCLFHNLSRGSLHNVSDIYDEVICCLHRFRPDFFASNELPTYYEPYEFKHPCLLQPQPSEDDEDYAVNIEAGANVNKVENSADVTRRCVAVPFVASGNFQSLTVAEKFISLIKEIKMQSLDVTSEVQSEDVSCFISKFTETIMCKFFLNGGCSRGGKCYFSHSLQVKRPLCKFFLTFQGCRNGDSCVFLHDYGPRILLGTQSNVSSQEDEATSACSFLQLLPSNDDGFLLVLNDKNLHFTSNLTRCLSPTSIIATTIHPDSSGINSFSTGLRVLYNVRESWQSILETKSDNFIPWKEVHSVLWFSDFEAEDAGNECHALQSFFEFLAIRILAEHLSKVRPIIVMNNIRFAQCQVERLARDCFFFLTKSVLFDESTFGRFSGSCGITRSMQVCRPICYAFEMVKPSAVQFGDVAAALRKGLYNNQ